MNLRLTHSTRCEQHYEIEQDGQSIGHALAVIERAGIRWQALTVATINGQAIRLCETTTTRTDAHRARRRQLSAIEMKANKALPPEFNRGDPGA